MAAAGDHQAQSPFYVLGLRPDQGRVEVEREGQKLLGMLELGLKSAATYATPLGPRPRTPELVRQAMADLRAPERRLLLELWAALPPPPPPPRPADPPAGHPFRPAPADASASASASASPEPPPPGSPPLPDTFALFGWRRP